MLRTLFSPVRAIFNSCQREEEESSEDNLFSDAKDNDSDRPSLDQDRNTGRPGSTDAVQHDASMGAAVQTTTNRPGTAPAGVSTPLPPCAPVLSSQNLCDVALAITGIAQDVMRAAGELQQYREADGGAHGPLSTSLRTAAGSLLASAQQLLGAASGGATAPPAAPVITTAAQAAGTELRVHGVKVRGPLRPVASPPAPPPAARHDQQLQRAAAAAAAAVHLPPTSPSPSTAAVALTAGPRDARAATAPPAPGAPAAATAGPGMTSEKRGRGRPRKQPGSAIQRGPGTPPPAAAAPGESSDAVEVTPVKRKPGRPRKKPLPSPWPLAAAAAAEGALYSTQAAVNQVGHAGPLLQEPPATAKRGPERHTKKRREDPRAAEAGAGAGPSPGTAGRSRRQRGNASPEPPAKRRQVTFTDTS